MPSGTRGQASIEFVALLPFLVAGVLGVAQIVLAGHAAWAAAGAARAAARASAVGGSPATAARGALPAHLDRSVRVRVRSAGDVEVRLRVPRLLPPVDLGSVRETARFEVQGS